ncbi:ABC transporter substrate-binding protein [Microvirga subterranea]|uniref:Branched-chain amino acid transport system substrate-binding protein n=1 Tax=Microvirga subterranea TaxID=186651 RepID=A0A370HIH0_9HYPH|nr:ABC transporter substrate-binding protein [Microvirga subterranea]RDI57991.1 branched-chain amino acid transport system substrate-binding protein [Microvirga subterranea]
MRFASIVSAAALAAALAPLPATAQQPCTHTVGVVVELTGPAGRFGQAAAKSVELAFKEINEAGGAAGCQLAMDLRDSQSQGSVAVDQARQLVDLKRVPAIIGGIISSVSLPVLTSVTAPAGVVQISPASSSPTLTRIAQEGKSNGIFFRTITSDALQGTAAAKYALDQGLKKIAIIHVNNDFGVNMVAEFKRAYEALGGEITSVTPYNQGQASYAPEVTRALAGDPPALYLVSYPGDGTSIARTWISQGGEPKFLLNDGMNSADFIRDVGPRYLNDAFGTSSGTTTTPSTEHFAKAYPAMSGGFDANAPAADRAYDAAAILGLAVARAGKFEAAAIRDSIRKVTGGEGEVIHAGPDGFKKALQLIKEGKPVRYEGVVGPVSFDQYGDITGPFRLWRIQNGEVTTIGQMGVDEVNAIRNKVPAR